MSGGIVPLGTVAPVDREAAAELLRAAAWPEQKPCPTCKDGKVDTDQKMIHTAVGPIGADWTLEAALDFLERAEEVHWIKNLFRHDLCAVLDGRTVMFQVMNPDWR